MNNITLITTNLASGVGVPYQSLGDEGEYTRYLIQSPQQAWDISCIIPLQTST